MRLMGFTAEKAAGMDAAGMDAASMDATGIDATVTENAGTGGGEAV